MSGENSAAPSRPGSKLAGLARDAVAAVKDYVGRAVGPVTERLERLEGRVLDLETREKARSARARDEDAT